MNRYINDYEHIRPKFHRNLLMMIDCGLIVYDHETHSWLSWQPMKNIAFISGNNLSVGSAEIFIELLETDRVYLKNIQELTYGTFKYELMLKYGECTITMHRDYYKKYDYNKEVSLLIRQMLSKVELDKINLCMLSMTPEGDKEFKLMTIEEKKLIKSLGTLLCLGDEDDDLLAENDWGKFFGDEYPEEESVSIDGFGSFKKEVEPERPSPIEENKKSELTCSEISKVVNSWNNAYRWSNYYTNEYHNISTPFQVSISLNSPTTASLPYTRYNSDLINRYLCSKVVGATIHNTKGDRYTFVSIGDDRVLEYLIYVGLVNEVKLFQGSEKIYATLKSNVMIGLTVLESAGVSEVNLTERTITFTYDSTGNDSYRQAVYGFDDFMDRVLKGDIYVRNFDMSEGRKLYIVKFC